MKMLSLWFLVTLICCTIINIGSAVVCYISERANDRFNKEMIKFLSDDFDRMAALVEKTKIVAQKVGIEC